MYKVRLIGDEIASFMSWVPFLPVPFLPGSSGVCIDVMMIEKFVLLLTGE
jgi:hypothetical protein